MPPHVPEPVLVSAFDDFAPRALVPEHLGRYVQAVGQGRPLRVGTFLGWRTGSSLVLVGYPKESAALFKGDVYEHVAEAAKRDGLDEATSEALALPWLSRLTVLAPSLPATLPPDATIKRDAYYGIELPVSPPPKVANMLRRASALCRVEAGSSWGSEHERLVAGATGRMLAREGNGRLEEEGAMLFSRIGGLFADETRQCRLFTARRLDNGQICGLAVGEYSSYTTSFYLFAFRSHDAPPGCADALLHALMAHGAENGHVRCNLGLCASEGIRFFKTKWGAKSWFPLVEATVEKREKGLVSRLLSRFRA